jgi:hypothetical protein
LCFSFRLFSGEQPSNYCNSLADPSAKSACLAAVPTFAEQQAQATPVSVFNQCLQSCQAAP